MAIDQRPNASFCRAIYDYNATDPASLSFKKNDILEVFNRLETGWWDGYLGDLRGWFPSNYVAVISDEEAEELLYGSESSLPLALASRHHGELSDDEWFDAETDRSVGSSTSGTPQSKSADPPDMTDYWMPEVTSSGQVNSIL